VTDQQGADELSKRERQKARRDARRKVERAQARREQVTGKLLKILGIVVALGLVGWLVGGWIINMRNENKLRDDALASLSSLGCDAGDIQPDVGAGHIEDLPALPPKAIYPDRPASSGPHIGTVAKSGVYDELVDERLMVHNLEHGYVNVFYDPDAPQDQIDDLKEFAEGKISAGNPKMIVAPKIGTWSSDKKFAFVAWRYRQMCDTFDRGVLLTFLDEHYGLKGVAPEKSVPAHMGGQGVIDPEKEDGPTLLPPLTADDPDPDPPASAEAEAAAHDDGEAVEHTEPHDEATG